MIVASTYDIGSTRQLKLAARLGELEKDAPATFESKIGEAVDQFMNGLAAVGITFHQEKPDRTKLRTPSAQQAQEGFDLVVVQGTRL